MKKRRLNFQAIESAARSNAEGCLRYLLNGEKRGNEFVAYNPTRTDKTLGSFSYNIRQHVWADFAVGHSGCGIISLWAYVRGQDYPTAATEVAVWLGHGWEGKFYE